MATCISVVLIVKDNASILSACLLSVKDLAHEIIVVDNGSTDKSVDVAQAHGAIVFRNHESNLGKLRAYALTHARGPWILSIDADERVSKELAQEILKIKNRGAFDGYIIPFRNHLFGKPIQFGGEGYKMMRFFKKESVDIKPAFVHERYGLRTERLGLLKNPIDHFSYRNIVQLFTKFSNYAVREARDRYAQGENVSLKKLTLYGPHMLYARYIKDKGYKDGQTRIILDLAFAYMEQITYLLLAFLYLKKRNR